MLQALRDSDHHLNQREMIPPLLAVLAPSLHIKLGQPASDTISLQQYDPNLCSPTCSTKVHAVICVLPTVTCCPLLHRVPLLGPLPPNLPKAEPSKELQLPYLSPKPPAHLLPPDQPALARLHLVLLQMQPWHTAQQASRLAGHLAKKGT